MLDSPGLRADLPALGVSPRELVLKLTKFVAQLQAIAAEPKKGLNDLALSLGERLRATFGCDAPACDVEFVLTTKDDAMTNRTIGELTARVKLGFTFEKSAKFELSLGKIAELATGVPPPPLVKIKVLLFVCLFVCCCF